MQQLVRWLEISPFGWCLVSFTILWRILAFVLTRMQTDALCVRPLQPAREVLREHDLHELRVRVLRPLQILDALPRV